MFSLLRILLLKLWTFFQLNIISFWRWVSNLSYWDWLICILKLLLFVFELLFNLLSCKIGIFLNIRQIWFLILLLKQIGLLHRYTVLLSCRDWLKLNNLVLNLLWRLGRIDVGVRVKWRFLSMNLWFRIGTTHIQLILWSYINRLIKFKL